MKEIIGKILLCGGVITIITLLLIATFKFFGFWIGIGVVSIFAILLGMMLTGY